MVAPPHLSRIVELSDWWKAAQPQLLYMPRWSCEELLACRRAIAPLDSEHSAHPLDNLEKGPVSASVEHVEDFFRNYGGIIRYAFDPSAKGSMQAIIANAFGRCDLAAMSLQLNNSLDLLPETTSWLLHYVVDETDDKFELTNITWAAAPILTAFVAFAKDRQYANLLHFIDSTVNMPILSSARGLLLEEVAHDAL